MRTSTRLSAQNKWRGILAGIGFTEKELSGAHGPCPICGGHDRYRFSDYKGGGEYYCSHCGPGNGFDLIMKTKDWDFPATAKEIDRLLGDDIMEVFKPKVDMEKRRRDLNALWAKGTDPDIVTEYMRNRGITLPVGDICSLRGIPDMYLSGSALRHRGLLAMMRDHNGNPVSIHRTYFATKERKIMPPLGEMRGTSVRLGTDPEDTVVVGEGIETTLAGMQHYDIKSGYAAISAFGMENLKLPGSISRIIILADNDKSFTGQKAAFTLARYLDSKGKDVKVAMSWRPGEDFNDVINSERDREIMEYTNS